MLRLPIYPEALLSDSCEPLPLGEKAMLFEYEEGLSIHRHIIATRMTSEITLCHGW